jgi:hypothetical protein
MKMRKELLREAAKRAVEERGFRVAHLSGAGIAPGARLEASNGSERPRKIAVRTSLSRMVGFARHKSGRWRTLPNVDDVVVAVPVADDAAAVEVLCFDARLMESTFDKTLQILRKQKCEPSFEAPIFIPLDQDKDALGNVTSGLAAKADWRSKIRTVSLSVLSSPNSDIGFVERVKREFAELNGVDVSKVVVEFRILV